LKVYDIGDTAYITLEHETYDFATNTWSLEDPDTGFPQITIIDPKGITRVPAVPGTPATMNRDTKGEFQYLYTIVDEAGWWRGYIEVENGGYPDKQPFSFKVRE